MPTSSRVLSGRFSTDLDVETLKTIIIFCGLGLIVSLFCAHYGLDLSGGLA